ncbi:MAG: DUF423 domain-containing protein [Fimbriimonadaceae bacterium]
MTNNPIRVAGVFGFLAVLLGAFGAHFLKSRITPELLVSFQTGVHYHLAHALALLALALSNRPFPRVFLAWTIGICIFSGTLYLYALTGSKVFAMITPLGGMCLMAGWVMLAFQSNRIERKAE